jgi:hypothetical protein
MTELDHPVEELFFDIKIGPERDRYDRPKLIPRGGTEEDRRPYTRMSSLADVLENHSAFSKWEKRAMAKGIADHLDLARLIAAESYTPGFTRDKDHLKANQAAGARIDKVIERAMDRALLDEKADYGTAIHSRTEPGNTGVDLDDRQREEVESFGEMLTETGIKLLATEMFVANDLINAAGTFDHLAYVPRYGICCTDKKTSSKPSSTYDVQLGGYIHGDIYDCEDDSRMTLEEYVESLGWDPGLINRADGFLFYIKNGKTQVRHLNLHQGWEDAQLAAQIHGGHRKKGVAKDLTKQLAEGVVMDRADLMTYITDATRPEHLLELWGNYRFRAIWTEAHTEAAKIKQEELNGNN